MEPSPSVNFYGRVISFKEPRQTRGRGIILNECNIFIFFVDWAMNIVVLDDSFEGRADLATQFPAGLSVMIFKEQANEFPAVKQIGDIVQFRHFKVNNSESFNFINILIF